MKLKINQSGFGAVEILLVLIFLTVIGFVGYTVSTNESSSQNATASEAQSATKEVAQATPAKEQEKLATSEKYSDKLIAGNVRAECQSGAGLKVCGDIKFAHSLQLDSVWIQYGKSPDALTKSSVPYTEELGLGTGEYGSAGFNVNYRELEPGTDYFFRVNGKSGDKMYQGQLGFFTTVK